MRKLILIASIGTIWMLGSAAMSAWVSAGYTWGTRSVPFYVNPTNADVSPEAAEAAVIAGASAWAEQSSASFSFYYGGRTTTTSLSKNRKNEVLFRNASGGGTVAETYSWYDSNGNLTDADIIFYDADFQFFTGDSGCSNGMYIEDIATHEFGHVLGLAHSPVGDATMYYGIGYCSIEWRTLADDDRQGIETLYPYGSTNTSPTVTITAPASNSSFADSSPVTFVGAANDKEDGDLSSRISWKSNINGPLGTGSTVTAMLAAGTHMITATVSDNVGASGSKSEAVTMTTTVVTPPPPSASSLALSTNGYKVKGMQRVDLSWSGAGSSSVDVYRNGTLVMSTPNDGAQSDPINKKGNGTYKYRLCESGTATCSAEVVVVF